MVDSQLLAQGADHFGLGAAFRQVHGDRYALIAAVSLAFLNLHGDVFAIALFEDPRS
jgi:hypothetical protein